MAAHCSATATMGAARTQHDDEDFTMTLDLAQISSIDHGEVAALPTTPLDEAQATAVATTPLDDEQATTAKSDERTVEGSPGTRALAAVVGLSNAGLRSALALRRAGLRIVAIETSPSRLADIRCGQVGLLDAQRGELRERCREGAFLLTDDMRATGAADLVLICVPATVDRQRRPSSDALRRACASVVRNARAGQTIVLSSTGCVGATRQLLVEPLAQRGLCVGEDVFVAFSPEQVQAEAEADGGPARLIVGAVTEQCYRHAAALLDNVAQELVRVSSPETAEMARLYESAFEALSVALAFEMADACKTYGLLPAEVANAAAARPLEVRASAGRAALPARRVASDPHHLLHPLRERGRPATLAEEAMRRVDARPRRLAMRAYELLARSTKQVRDARVLIVGASSEPVVGERREVPAVEVIERLRATGAQVDYHDPLVPVLVLDGEDVYSVDPDPRRDASGFGPEDYDLAVIVATREGYDYGWLRRCPQVLDCTYGERTGRRFFLP